MQYTTHLLRHMRTTIGHNIHQLRSRKRMPMHKLARLSHIPELKLDHYEIGKSDIRLEELLRIACVFQVEVATLLKA